MLRRWRLHHLSIIGDVHWSFQVNPGLCIPFCFHCDRQTWKKDRLILGPGLREFRQWLLGLNNILIEAHDNGELLMSQPRRKQSEVWSDLSSVTPSSSQVLPLKVSMVSLNSISSCEGHIRFKTGSEERSTHAKGWLSLWRTFINSQALEDWACPSGLELELGGDNISSRSGNALFCVCCSSV